MPREREKDTSWWGWQCRERGGEAASPAKGKGSAHRLMTPVARPPRSVQPRLCTRRLIALFLRVLAHPHPRTQRRITYNAPGHARESARAHRPLRYRDERGRTRVQPGGRTLPRATVIPSVIDRYDGINQSFDLERVCEKREGEAERKRKKGISFREENGIRFRISRSVPRAARIETGVIISLNTGFRCQWHAKVITLS